MNRRDFFTTLIAFVAAIKSPKIFASIWREITGHNNYSPIQFTKLGSVDFKYNCSDFNLFNPSVDLVQQYKIGTMINVRRPMRFKANTDLGCMHFSDKSVMITSEGEV